MFAIEKRCFMEELVRLSDAEALAVGQAQVVRAAPGGQGSAVLEIGRE
ncbi:hypothetical protein [Streptomyces arenae]|nr:hypothetical protein [Streptomyces arenae]MCG7206626.1 hypothetical protein [Streptomyces arenae]